MWARKTIEELHFGYPNLLLPDLTNPITIMDVTEDQGIANGIAKIHLALGVLQTTAPHVKITHAGAHLHVEEGGRYRRDG